MTFNAYHVASHQSQMGSFFCMFCLVFIWLFFVIHSPQEGGEGTTALKKLFIIGEIIVNLNGADIKYIQIQFLPNDDFPNEVLTKHIFLIFISPIF